MTFKDFEQELPEVFEEFKAWYLEHRGLQSDKPGRPRKVPRRVWMKEFADWVVHYYDTK